MQREKEGNAKKERRISGLFFRERLVVVDYNYSNGHKSFGTYLPIHNYLENTHLITASDLKCVTNSRYISPDLAVVEQQRSDCRGTGTAGNWKKALDDSQWLFRSNRKGGGGGTESLGLPRS